MHGRGLYKSKIFQGHIRHKVAIRLHEDYTNLLKDGHTKDAVKSANLIHYYKHLASDEQVFRKYNELGLGYISFSNARIHEKELIKLMGE